MMIEGRELNRLRLGPENSERPNGLGTVRFLVHCSGNAEAVLRNAREVMEIVLRFSAEEWPSSSKWHSLLPAWFIATCAPEMSIEEAERFLELWRRLPPEEQIETERCASWSVSDWLHWMHPNERQWSWWDASISGPDQVLVAVTFGEWPFAWGALNWLLRASGGQKVTPIDEEIVV